MTIPSAVLGLLEAKSMAGDNKPSWTVTVKRSGLPDLEVQYVESVLVERSLVMAGTLMLTLDNRAARYAPDAQAVGEEMLWPNSEIIVTQGYGDDQTTTFSGLIDRVVMSSYPQRMMVFARDRWKLLLDQIITDGDGDHVVSFEDETAEAIFAQLAEWAGWAPGDITTEASGITIDEKTWVYDRYGNAIEWLCELTGFEVVHDYDTGEIFFRYATDRQPEKEDDAVVLTGTDWADLEHSPIVSDSERVWSGAGQTGTEYTEGTDYEIDLAGGRIRRIDTGGIGSGTTVYVTYVYARWGFTEGADLITLDYIIDDDQLYQRVLVHGIGDDGDAIEGEEYYTARNYYEVLPHKVLKVDVPAAKTQTLADDIAARMALQIRTKARMIRFAAVAIPWLEVGDCVRVVETGSTISEIYRVTSIAYRQGAAGFVMECDAHYYGYAPLT